VRLSALIPVVLAISSTAASAQFTTVTRPAPRTAQAVDTAPTRAQRDSVARVTLTDLRTWVDSAANVALVSDDSIPQMTDSATTVVRAPARTIEPRRTTAFSEGAVAPATATQLPLLALLGLGALGLGALLLRRKRA
jgi:LPXTG-motif cell wall-anchored protein